MARNLKQIDKDILKRIKKIHELVTRWSSMTEEDHDAGEISDYYYEQTGSVKMKIEMEIRAIYKDVMEQEEIDAIILNLNKK